MAATAAHTGAQRRQAKPGHGSTTAPLPGTATPQQQGRRQTTHRHESMRPGLQTRWGRMVAWMNSKSTRMRMTAVVGRVDCAPWRGPSPAESAGIERRRWRRPRIAREGIRVRVRTRARERERSEAGRAGPGGSVDLTPLGYTDRWAQGHFCHFTILYKCRNFEK